MAFGNKFFAFDKPVRWFKAVGHSPSNTYIGSSRAIDTVHQQSLVNPGDVIHDLSGALWLVRKDGSVETGKLKLPKHLLEKTYGIPETPSDIMGRMAKAGYCREIPQPAGKVDYNGARKAVDAAPRYPECTGQVLPGGVESPLMRVLREAAVAAGLPEAAQAAGGKVHMVDVGMAGEPHTTACMVSVRIPGSAYLDVSATPERDGIQVGESRDGGFVAALRDEDPEASGVTGTFRSERYADIAMDQVEPLMLALASWVEHGRFAEPSSPAP